MTTQIFTDTAIDATQPAPAPRRTWQQSAVDAFGLAPHAHTAAMTATSDALAAAAAAGDAAALAALGERAATAAAIDALAPGAPVWVELHPGGTVERYTRSLWAAVVHGCARVAGFDRYSEARAFLDTAVWLAAPADDTLRAA